MYLVLVIVLGELSIQSIVQAFQMIFEIVSVHCYVVFGRQ